MTKVPQESVIKETKKMKGEIMVLQQKLEEKQNTIKSMEENLQNLEQKLSKAELFKKENETLKSKMKDNHQLQQESTKSYENIVENLQKGFFFSFFF